MSNFFKALKPTGDFEMVAGTVIRQMDVLTIGVYSKLLTLTEEWETSVKGLARAFDISEDKARRSINLLEDLGFIRRLPRRSADGRTLNGYDYIVLGVQADLSERTKPGISLSQKQPCLISAMSENGQGNNIHTGKYKQNKKKKQINLVESASHSDELAQKVDSVVCPDAKASAKEDPAVGRIYRAYPSQVMGAKGNVRHLKSREADMAKISRLLKKGTYTEEQLLSIIECYLADETPAFYKNFSTFLNNIPDCGDEPTDMLLGSTAHVQNNIDPTDWQ